MATSAQTREVALDHYADRQRFVGATGEVLGDMWAEVNPDNIAGSWAGMLPEATAIVTGAQLGAARPADDYLDEALAAQDVDPTAAADVNPAAFAGVASDGRGLMALLANPVVVTLMSIQDGMDVARALGMGRVNLDMLARTQVADAGRLADQVAITARPAATGYVRVAVGATCARCLILAGRRYTWSAGFKRHPMCDCVHLPAGVAAHTSLVRHPREIYDQMTRAERLRAGFTVADQRAIALGGDIDQIVNVRHHPESLPVAGRRSQRATTTVGAGPRSLAGRRLRGDPRLTVDEILRRTGNDRTEALRLLRRNGYVLQIPGQPIGGAVSVPALTTAAELGGTGGVAGAAALVTVRPALQSAGMVGAVGRAFRAEYARITGRQIPTATFRGDVATAREHAEGLLRGVERFPEARLIGVGPVNDTAAAVTQTVPDGSYVRFSDHWTARRPEYLNGLANDVASGFHPVGTASPVAIAIHEFGHVLDLGTLGEAIRPDLRRLIFRRAAERDSALDALRAAGQPISADDYVAGMGATGLIRREVSEYATRNTHELVAEAFGDVMMNGARASRLSREIVDLLEAEYRRGTRRSTTAITAPAELDLARMTVVQLRALARERGIRGYSRMVKADLVAVLRAAPAPGAADALAGMTVVQLRALARERGIRGYSRMAKADLQSALRTPVPTSMPVPPTFPNRAIDSIDKIMDRFPTFDQMNRIPWDQRGKIVNDVRDELARAFTGEFAGLTVKVVDVMPFRNYLSVMGQILDPRTGKRVGGFTRRIERNSAGELTAHHDFLQIGPKYRGSGFAEAFNRNLYDWYRRSGIARVEVHANIDVGGYTWATQGFDFASTAEANRFLGVAIRKAEQAERGRVPRGLTKDQVADLAAYLRSIRDNGLTLSAPDIAQFGRQPGQGGKSAVWAGKWLMLKSDWHGTLYL